MNAALEVRRFWEGVLSPRRCVGGLSAARLRGGRQVVN